jgi:hypothetical protein
LLIHLSTDLGQPSTLMRSTPQRIEGAMIGNLPHPHYAPSDFSFAVVVLVETGQTRHETCLFSRFSARFAFPAEGVQKKESRLAPSYQ